jgi:hypothetical protein
MPSPKELKFLSGLKAEILEFFELNDYRSYSLNQLHKAFAIRDRKTKEIYSDLVVLEVCAYVLDMFSDVLEICSYYLVFSEMCSLCSWYVCLMFLSFVLIFLFFSERCSYFLGMCS